MKYFKYLIQSLKNKIFPDKLSFVSKDDIPDKYKKNVIYIIGEQSSWLLTFLCPCGCQKTIMLNLLPEEKPNWNYTINNKKISIEPSVRRTTGCKSHFWIKKGRIRWCID